MNRAGEEYNALMAQKGLTNDEPGGSLTAPQKARRGSSGVKARGAIVDRMTQR